MGKEEKSIKFTNVNMNSKKAQTAVKKAGLSSHGIIATNAEGKVVKTVEGHSYGKEKVKEVVDALLKNSS